MSARTTATVWQVVLVCVAMVLVSSEAMAQTPAKTNEAAAVKPWTYDEAKAQLKRYPKDVCLQYITMKLAQRAGLDPSNAVMSERMRQRQRQRRQSRERSEDVDLFKIFSGSLAVQESLQLDAMQARADDKAVPAEETVLISELTGPTVKSHPWEEMLAGRKPEMSRRRRWTIWRRPIACRLALEASRCVALVAGRIASRRTGCMAFALIMVTPND